MFLISQNMRSFLQLSGTSSGVYSHLIHSGGSATQAQETLHVLGDGSTLENPEEPLILAKFCPKVDSGFTLMQTRSY